MKLTHWFGTTATTGIFSFAILVVLDAHLADAIFGFTIPSITISNQGLTNDPLHAAIGGAALGAAAVLGINYLKGQSSSGGHHGGHGGGYHGGHGGGCRRRCGGYRRHKGYRRRGGYHSSGGHYGRRRRDAEQQDFWYLNQDTIDIMAKSDPKNCIGRLICDISTGEEHFKDAAMLLNVVPTEDSQIPLELKTYAFRLKMARKLGEQFKNVHLCETTFKCPISSNQEVDLFGKWKYKIETNYTEAEIHTT